jgi:dihydroorotase
MAHDFDLIITAGRVFCADTSLDGPGAVAVKDGRIVASGPDVSGTASETHDFQDCVLLPGLVDMHAHPAPSTWKYGIDPDVEILPRGTTTIMSQGDSGAAHWPEYRDTIIRGSKTRVKLAISAAINGETGTLGTPCFENIDDLNVDAAVSAIEDGGDDIWGVAVNCSEASSGRADPRVVFARALEMAERTGKPLLFGERWEPYDWPIADQLEQLRPGDVVTYCFHASPNGLVENGKIIDAAWKARERGILFDIAHGMNSFDFPTAEAAIADGFLPDTISTDQYVRHVGSNPQHDLLRTLSKLLASGMSEGDAFPRVTQRPAQILGLEGEVGTLASGSCADLCVAKWNENAAPLVDVSGVSRSGGCYEPVLTVRSGGVFLE